MTLTDLQVPTRVEPTPPPALEYQKRGRWIEHWDPDDDEFWERMFAHYSQAEVVELSMCLGSWIAFGRLNRVLGLDVACMLPTHAQDKVTSV